MAHSVSGHLKLHVDEYDELIRRLVPAYPAMRPVQLALLELALRDGRGRILDLGGGTGALAAAIAREFPAVDPPTITVTTPYRGASADPTSAPATAPEKAPPPTSNTEATFGFSSASPMPAMTAPAPTIPPSSDDATTSSGRPERCT